MQRICWKQGLISLNYNRSRGHVSILTTSRYTHLTSNTGNNAHQAANTLVNGFDITWGGVK